MKIVGKIKWEEIPCFIQDLILSGNHRMTRIQIDQDTRSNNAVVILKAEGSHGELLEEAFTSGRLREWNREFKRETPLLGMIVLEF